MIRPTIPGLLSLVSVLVNIPALAAEYKSPWDVERPKTFWVNRAALLKNQVPHGVILRSLPAGSSAEAFGLVQYDLLIKIGDIETTDSNSYYGARDFYSRQSLPTAIVLWRAGRQMTLQGQIKSPFGPSVVEYDYVLESIFDLLDGGDLKSAKALIERAETQKLLTPKNLLIAKLIAGPDVPVDASEDRTRMANELRSMVERPNLDQFDTWTKFYEHGAQNVAAYILEKYVAENPNATNEKINYGLSLARANRNDEADAVADYYLSPKPTPVGSIARNINWFGLYNVHWIRSITAQNRGNLEEGWNQFIQAFACSYNHNNDDVMHLLFIAAKLRDPVRFDVARQFAKILPSPDVVPYLDSLDAFLLSDKDETRAKQIVAKWRSKPEESDILKHWTREFPEVAAAWKRLQ